MNFSLIGSGLYRSGFPVDVNFPFISRLRLHTILNLASEEYSHDTVEFLQSNNISCVSSLQRGFAFNLTPAHSYVHIPLTGNRWATSSPPLFPFGWTPVISQSK
jgi:protein tyrosine/serine phosphatase